MRRAAVLALALAACFDPDYPENVTCGPGGFCPEGQSCGADNLCRSSGTPDAATSDGPARDAAIADAAPAPDRPPLDAPPVDAPPVDARPVDASAPPDASVDGSSPPPDAAAGDAGDTTPPTATSTPATSVLADDACVTITFSETMNTASVTLSGPLAALPHTATWLAGSRLTVCPSASFWPASDPSRALIVGGSDLAGNPMTAMVFDYDAPPLEAFVHATAVPATMGGIAGADAICQSAATTAGLHGIWAAWLSTPTSDVYCRLHGLTGTRAGNCGQAALPTSAGPWIRRDGAPFLLIGSSGIPRQFTPPVTLADGTVPVAAVTGNGYRLWTSTNRDGGYAGTTSCSDWSGTSGNVVSGDSATVMYWTNGSTDVCTNSNRLVCLEVGAGGPLPGSQTGKMIFVSSQTGTGNLSTWPGVAPLVGVAAADAVCRSLAHGADLQFWGTFRAWLSTSVQAAPDRLLDNGPYVRYDGVRIASSKADLTDGVLRTSVLYTQAGVPNDYSVYTGTTATGGTSTATCNNWTNGLGSYSGRGGRSDYVSGSWTDLNSYTCSTALALYCVEDKCAACTGTQWQCPRSCDCINPGQVCDFTWDCPDGEDEAGCP